jgi:hypothetical protein
MLKAGYYSTTADDAVLGQTLRVNHLKKSNLRCIGPTSMPQPSDDGDNEEQHSRSD